MMKSLSENTHATSACVAGWNCLFDMDRSCILARMTIYVCDYPNQTIALITPVFSGVTTPFFMFLVRKAGAFLWTLHF